MNELAEKSTVSRAVQWESSSGRLEIRLWDTFSSEQVQVFRKVQFDEENQVPIKGPSKLVNENLGVNPSDPISKVTADCGRNPVSQQPDFENLIFHFPFS